MKTIAARRLLVEEAQQSMTSPHAWAVLKYIRETYPRFWEEHQDIIDPELNKIYHHLDLRHKKTPASKRRRQTFFDQVQEFFYGTFKCELCGSTECSLKCTKGFPHPPSRWCSQSCSKANEEAFEARESTCLEKYGYRNVTYAPSVKKKQRSSWSKVDRNELRAKKNATIIRRHGSLEVAIARRIAKAGITNLVKYGNVCPIHGKAQRKKCINTWIQNLGVDNPSKSPEVYDKITDSRMKKRKKVKFGKTTHMLQGYEPQALEFMATELGIKPTDVWSKKVLMPKFLWTNPESKSGVSRYYPDFMLRSPKGYKWFVEVKSSWTLGLEKGAKNSGHHFTTNRKKLQSTLDRFPMFVFVDGVMFKFPVGSKVPPSSYFRREIKRRASEAHSLSLRSLSKVVLLTSDS